MNNSNDNFEIVTIENDEAFVTVDTMVKFSGNADYSVKELIRENEKDILEFGGSTPKWEKTENGRFKWDTVRLNEDQASYLLTLMANSPQVKLFKKNLIKEFRRLKDLALEVKSPMQLIQEAIILANEQVEKEKAAKARALNMLQNAKLIEATNEENDDDISVEEFCKMISDKFSVLIGRTMVYHILREMGLVMKDSTKPTQRGLMVYLRYRKHERGYSTRVFIHKADKLSKYMLKFLVNNPEINEALGNPFDI